MYTDVHGDVPNALNFCPSILFVNDALDFCHAILFVNVHFIVVCFLLS